MDNQTVKTEFRQKAVEWLNSKDRKFDKGMNILKDAGYKPNVVANFEKNKNRGDIPKKLLAEIRLYIRYCSNPQADNPIHEDEIKFVDPERSFVPNVDKLLDREYPPLIKRLITECSDLYKGRSILHKELKAVGEKNDEQSMAERKRIMALIDASSRRMDVLWPIFKEYKKSGIEPDASLFEQPFDPAQVITESTKKEEALVLPDSVDELKKMSENWRTKLLKAENKLEFQSTKKEQKPNPMPAGPKRILQEKKIAQLKTEKEAIDLKIAELV